VPYKALAPSRRAVIVLGTGAALASGLPPGSLAKPVVQTQVMVLATLHGLHKTTATYGYDELYRAVAAFRPDRVGVEIRQQDLGQPNDYLTANYPLEMIELAHRYEGKVFGFDWLGDDLDGRLIPSDWNTTQSPLKAMERAIDDDPVMKTPAHSADAAAMTKARAEQDAVLRSATATSLGDGRYDEASRRYYKAFEAFTEHTRYAALSRFYEERDRKLAHNIVRAAKASPGARIAVACGADHHGPIVMALRSARISQVSVTGAGGVDGVRDLPAEDAGG